ncbi:DUF4097 family beta strand repeat-containing protein [Streptosporangium amethystogenes]|uniref:DUF4097 family beta strand repeat-containing protein n=1 Tax=Streptosporangium amethystogenes TaxID=2002 RepID=UPI0037A40C69
MPIRSNARKAWIIVGGTLTALTVGLTSIAAWSEVTQARRVAETTLRSHALTSPGIVVETTGHVNVSVVGGADRRLDLERTLQWTLDRPVVTEDWDGRTLTIGVRCPGGDRPDGPNCRANYTLSLPVTTDVEVTSRFGTVSVNGVQGDLRLSTTAGDVVVGGSRGALRVRAEAGNVSGTGLRSTGADVETGRGNIDLGFAGPPGDVRAVVRTAGDVEVRVPGEDGYDVRAGDGNAIIQVRRDSAAPRRITTVTAAGELRILPS